MLSTQSNGREPAVEVEPVQNFSLQGQGLLTVDGSARQQARTSSSTNSKPKAVLNPLAEAFSFGIEPDSPQIRPFYGTTADEAAGQTGNFVVPKIPSELEAPQAAEPQASDARAGGMLGFSPFSPGDEIFVPRTSSRGGQRPAPIAAHKAGYTGDGDVDVSSPRPTPATSGYQHMHQLYGQGNLPQTRAQYHPEQQQQASADASVNGLRSTPLRSPIVGGLVSSSANTAGSGDLPAWYTEDSYERSPNLGLRAGVAAPSFPSGRRTPEELNESMDQNSYAARGVSGWDRAAISRSGLGPSVNNRFAAPPPRVGPYGVGPTGLTAGPLNSRSSYGDELYSRYAAPSTSSRRGAEDDAMFLQMAREEQLALRNAAARRAVADEYFDPTRRLQSVQSGAIRGRSVEEELMLRQMEMQARQGIPRRPRYTPEPAPPGPAAYPNELAAFLQSTGRAQNKTWVETHGGDPSVFESRRPKIREDIAAGRFRTDLGAYPPGAGIPPRPAGGRVTPTMNHDEQLIFQQLSQLPPHQRQAALIRLAQQQRQAGDDRDLAARFGSLSFSSGSSGDTSSGPGGNVDVARYGLGIAGAVADGAPSKPSSSLRSISPPRSAVGSSPSTIRGDLSPKQASKGIVPPAKRANLDTLPHGVLLRILNYLKPGQYTFSDLDPPSPSPTRDLHALLRVSKRIHFATVPVLWSRLILRTDPHVRSCIASVARRVQWQGPGGSLAIWTRSIEVWGAVPAEVASALRVIVMEATREGNGGIRELALTCAPGMDEYILFRMFESTEPMKLETLRLRGPGVTDRMCSMIAMWARHVQRLEIISGTVTDQGIAQVVQNPNLRSLELRRCLRLSDFTLQAVSVHARKLETLVLDMAAPANGVQTQSRLGMPAAVTDRGLIELARTCRNLRRVELTDCDVSDIGLDSLVIAGRDLEVLEISTTDTAMKALAAIAGANPGAVDIATLANSLPLRSLGDRSLQNLFRSCQALRRFKLSSRHLSLNVPGASLARLFQNCGRLASLDLSRSRVSDRALVAALSMSVAWDSGLLTELAGLYDSSDASGRLLLPLLRHLLLQDCAEIGDGSLAEISRAFPNLSVLSLARDPTPVPAGHPTIGDDATASLIDSLGGKLRLLDLSFSEVGPKTLARIAERCKKLEVLNLVGCRNVSTVDGLIESIVERCPRLRILGFDRETEQLLSIVGKHRSVGTRGQKAALRIARNRLVWEGWQLVEEVSGYKVFSCDLD